MDFDYVILSSFSLTCNALGDSLKTGFASSTVGMVHTFLAVLLAGYISNGTINQIGSLKGGGVEGMRAPPLKINS